MADDEFIERRILIGIVTSTEYVQKIQKIFQPTLLTSTTCRTLCLWCLEFYAKYGKAPGRDLEGIFDEKKKDLPTVDSDDIRDILVGLSDEYIADPPNAQFLFDETALYFKRRKLKNLTDDISEILLRGNGNLADAESLVLGYSPLISDTSTIVDPFAGIGPVRSAFRSRQKPLVRFGNLLGEFWDAQFVRDAFIALLSPEKRGKSWMLLDCSLKGKANGCNVAFFQAGDMSEQQQLIRLYTKVSGRPFPGFHNDEDEELGYSGAGMVVWVPVVDCVLNQQDYCDRPEREDNRGYLFDMKEWKTLQEQGGLGAALRAKADQHDKWMACRNCRDIQPTVFLQKQKTQALTEREAYKAAQQWQRQFKSKFKISTHINGTLSVAEIRTQLDLWKRDEGFVPDMITIDYADLLAPDSDFAKLDQRNQVNKIWQRLRALSEERNCLVLTATQAAATAYDRKGPMKMIDFSEDKRKYAHVTAMYGLNQSPEEKKLGILRINQMVVREGDFHIGNTVTVLQCLALGRPLLGSY